MKVTLLFIIVFLAIHAEAAELKIISQDYLPFAGKGEGDKSVGAFVEIAENGICKKLAYTCKFEIYPIRRGEKMIIDGEAHLFLAFIPNPERRQTMFFSPSISSSESTFYVMKGKSGAYKSNADLLDKKIGVFGPSALTVLLSKTEGEMGKKFSLEVEPGSATPLRKLDGGRYGENGAAFANSAVAAHQKKTENLSVEQVAFKGIPSFHGIAMSKKGVPEPDAKKIYDSLLEYMKTDDAKAILKKWGLEPFTGTNFGGPNG